MLRKLITALKYDADTDANVEQQLLDMIVRARSLISTEAISWPELETEWCVEMPCYSAAHLLGQPSVLFDTTKSSNGQGHLQCMEPRGRASIASQ